MIKRCAVRRCVRSRPYYANDSKASNVASLRLSLENPYRQHPTVDYLEDQKMMGDRMTDVMIELQRETLEMMLGNMSKLQEQPEVPASCGSNRWRACAMRRGRTMRR